MGYKYRFDWKALKESSAGVNVITDPNGAFNAEYEAVKMLHNTLSSVSTDEDDDLFDD